MLIQKAHRAKKLQKSVCGKGLAKLRLWILIPAVSHGACSLLFTILNIVVAPIFLKRTRLNPLRYIYISFDIIFCSEIFLDEFLYVLICFVCYCFHSQVTVNSGGVVFFALFNHSSSEDASRKEEAAAVIKFSSSRMATQSERLGYEFARWLGVQIPQVLQK